MSYCSSRAAPLPSSCSPASCWRRLCTGYGTCSILIRKPAPTGMTADLCGARALAHPVECLSQVPPQRDLASARRRALVAEHLLAQRRLALHQHHHLVELGYGQARTLDGARHFALCLFTQGHRHLVAARLLHLRRVFLLD